MVFMPLEPIHHFYPRPPRGGRRVYNGAVPDRRRNFYPRPPRGGRPSGAIPSIAPRMISIHALREEGDDLLQVGDVLILEFLSTPSARRATEGGSGYRLAHQDFYPRPPRGGRHQLHALSAEVVVISIHALREEGDGDAFCGYRQRSISIHALREEGDPAQLPFERCPTNFYPRPPRGGRRGLTGVPSNAEQFLSTPSARRATCIFVSAVPIALLFLSTPSARRATLNRYHVLLWRTISIHALREEGDTTQAGPSISPGYFYPRPPRGGRLSRMAGNAAVGL